MVCDLGIMGLIDFVILFMIRGFMFFIVKIGIYNGYCYYYIVVLFNRKYYLILYWFVLFKI